MSNLYSTKCKNCHAEWISPTDDDYCDPCVIAGNVQIICGDCLRPECKGCE